MMMDMASTMESAPPITRKRIKAARERSSLSQTDLARISGVSRQTINEIESGKRRPLPATMRTLADALGIDYPRVEVA